METFRIMLVEDNPGDVYLLKLALKNAGIECELTAFTDGAEALKFVLSQGEDAARLLPHLAVLDMNLPKKSGTEVLEAMRRGEEFAKVPVVMMSSSASPHDQAKTKQFGGTWYLTKPGDLEGYLKIGETLKEILADSRAASPASE